MVTFMRTITFFSVIDMYLLFFIAEGDKKNVSNYTNSKASCHNRGGLITQNLLKYDGLLKITCEFGVDNDVLKDGESVWIQGKAQTGPYIALHTCMRFRNVNKQSIIKTFYSNILYECSVYCGLSLHSTGYLGIYKDSCLCLPDSFRFPHTPECLGNDFMDTQKGIIVFRLIKNGLLDVQTKSANFNCLGVLVQDDGETLYDNAKCGSTLGSICKQRIDGNLSNECLPRLREFCFNEENDTLLEHYRKCWFFNGTLLPFIAGITEPLNYSVMLGSFRAFKAIDDDGGNNSNAPWPCLSITQFNGTKYLETENCSNENAFICMDDIQDESKGVPIIILISLLIPTFTAIDIAIAFGIWWKCRRRRKCRGTSPNDAPHLSGEPENGPPQAEIAEGEENIPRYADSIDTEAACNPSQCVSEAQQSKNIYSHLRIWHDEDDDTYDTARFHKVLRRQCGNDRDLSDPNLPFTIVND